MKNNIIDMYEKHNYIVYTGNFLSNINQDIKSLRKKLLSEDFETFNYTEMYGDDFDIDLFSSTILSPPMMDQYKIVLIKNAYILNKDIREKINTICEELSKSVILIIIDINENVTYSESIRKSQYFKNAHIIKMFKPEKLRQYDINNLLKEKGINIPKYKIQQILDITNNNYEIAKNIINFGWMLNDDSLFEQMIDSSLSEDFSPILHYDFIKNFFLKNVNKTYDLYKKIIKWKILNIDEMINILLLNIEKIEKMKQDFEKNGEEIIEKKYIGRIPDFKKREIINEKINTCNAWNFSEIKKLYIDMYELLRKSRTINRNYIPFLFEQILIKYSK